jgi:CDP-glucose 4,6-dehydratase
MFCEHWGNGACWESGAAEGPHEANYLKLDCSKIKKTFGWYPRWHIEEAIEKTCEWAKAWVAGEDVSLVMDRQIAEYLESR